MSDWDFDAVLVTLLAVALGGGMVYVFARSLIDRRKKNQKIIEEMEQPFIETPLFECKATIVEKFHQKVNKAGFRVPNTQELCYLVIKTPDGKLHNYEVSLEKYCNAKENQEVTVVLEGNKIFDINF